LPTAKVTTVSTSSVSFSGLSPEEVIALIRLCDYWLARITTLKETETARLLDFAKQLAPEELNALSRSYEDPLDPNPFSHR